MKFEQPAVIFPWIAVRVWLGFGTRIVEPLVLLFRHMVLPFLLVLDINTCEAVGEARVPTVKFRSWGCWKINRSFRHLVNRWIGLWLKSVCGIQSLWIQRWLESGQSSVQPCRRAKVLSAPWYAMCAIGSLSKLLPGSLVYPVMVRLIRLRSHWLCDLYSCLDSVKVVDPSL